MRQIVLDTETTGLSVADGHRIIEIGAVELINRRPTRKTFQAYINPERNIEFAAQEVHGITNEFLKDKPVFAQIVEEFLQFVHGAELVIHNAPFDVAFINHELKLANYSIAEINHCCSVIDTLVIARQKHPGQKNSLDALCRRYNIDNSHRELHGALLDARLLADVYLAMTGGQGSLFTEEAAGGNFVMAQQTQQSPSHHEFLLPVIHATEAELKEHESYLQHINKTGQEKCLWLKI